MFKYPKQIRRIIYTTNAIENLNRQLRKITKTKSALVSDGALLKQLYLVTMHVTEKWTMPIKGWGSILMQLMIFFGGRVNVTLRQLPQRSETVMACCAFCLHGSGFAVVRYRHRAR